ncbi:MAG: AAA family ATPase [Nitrospirales bacterium]|nr:AAA family ATPase [Nitrospirales bacterium]
MNPIPAQTKPKGFQGLTVAAFESRMAVEMAKLIERFGGKPIVAASMREIPLEENTHALEFGRRLMAGQVDMLILLTGVGIRVLVDVWKTHFPIEGITDALSRTTLLVRGPKPALVVKELGLTPDLVVPEPNTWHDILSTLDAFRPRGFADVKIGIQEYGMPNLDLLQALRDRGAIVQQVPVYRWGLPDDLGPLRKAIAAFLASEIDVVLFTNAVQIDHVLQIVHKDQQTEQFLQVAHRTVMASIGQITSDRLRSHGLPVDMEPSHPKMGILVKEVSGRAQELLKRKRERAPSALIAALHNPAVYSHAIQPVDVLETHISWVLLTGTVAYKIKKPVNLGFVDFSTVEKRHKACLEELRLNQRLAPDLYLEIMPISGTPTMPNFNNDGTVFEYAVKMKQFPHDALLPSVLERTALREDHLDSLADDLAHFHEHIAVADQHSEFGSPDRIHQAVKETFDQVPLNFLNGQSRESLNALKAWMEKTHAACLEDFRRRQYEGHIRECHGDLHLGNMVLRDDRIQVFDGIDFNENLRWIDVLSEVAFLAMDLKAWGRFDLSARFVNRYLEWTGDYHGLTLLRYYEIYRALVRMKVASLRLTQKPLLLHDQDCLKKDYNRYAKLAERFMKVTPVGVILMHGLSGSGKTTISQMVLQETGAIRIRSDVERKRLFGHKPDCRSDASIDSELYAHDATHVTYQHLHMLTEQILDARFPVLLDATFLRQHDRKQFQALANDRNIPFYILDLSADEMVLRRRLRSRHEEGCDASDATEIVLDRQLAEAEPLEEDEEPHVIRIVSGSVIEPTQRTSWACDDLLMMMDRFRSWSHSL